MSEWTAIEPITIWGGTGGSGKSYLVCTQVVPALLAERNGSTVWHNLPINEAALWEYLELPEEERSRLKRIPQDVLATWEDGTSGPWEFWPDPAALAGCHIILDEAHNLIPKDGMPRASARKWLKWAGYVRHYRARLYLVSQDEESILHSVRRRAAVRYEIASHGAERDVFWNISLYDWYVLRSLVLSPDGKLEKRSFVLQFVKRCGRWVPTDYQREIRLDSTLYKLYNSYSASGGTADGDDLPRGTLATLWWFWRRNWWFLCFNRRVWIMVAMIVCITFGLFGWAIQYAQRDLSEAIMRGTRVQAAKVAADNDTPNRPPLTAAKCQPVPLEYAETPVTAGAALLECEWLLSARDRLIAERSRLLIERAEDPGGVIEGLSAGGIWCGPPVSKWVPVGARVPGGLWIGCKVLEITDNVASLLAPDGTVYHAGRGLRSRDPARSGAGAVSRGG